MRIVGFVLICALLLLFLWHKIKKKKYLRRLCTPCSVEWIRLRQRVAATPFTKVRPVERHSRAMPRRLRLCGGVDDYRIVRAYICNQAFITAVLLCAYYGPSVGTRAHTDCQQPASC